MCSDPHKAPPQAGETPSVSATSKRRTSRDGYAMIRLYAIAALALWGAATDADAGAWTLPRGEFWGKLTYFRHSTEEWYLGKGRFGTPGARVR